MFYIKLYVLCKSDGKLAYNVGCLTFTYTERYGAENKIAEYVKRYKGYLKQYKGKTLPSWVVEPNFVIKEIELTKGGDI